MEYHFPIDVLYVLKALQQNGYEAYIVGGAVRDLLTTHQSPTDWDFTTSATPNQILEVFQESFYENTFGTVAVTRSDVCNQFQLPDLSFTQEEASLQFNQTIKLQEATKLHASLHHLPNSRPKQESIKSLFEITTFRSDGKYTDFRRPDVVHWGQTLEEDLRRRDFTFNAMAIHIDLQVLQKIDLSPNQKLRNDQVLLIDPHGGLNDIARKSIQTVGEPVTRFQEDALRMMRVIRFSVQLGYQIDQKTYQAVQTAASLIQHVSWERIRDEFLKMLASAYPRNALELLDQSGLLLHLLPELVATKGVEQAGHHIHDVWTHSLSALEHCPSKDPIVRFATLLHDIAKPTTFNNANGKITFYNHELVGARVAKNIATRFKLSKRDTQRVFVLVRHHMFYYQPHNTDASIRRFMRKVGLENINDILDLRIGDRLGSGSNESSWRLEEMKTRMQAQLHQPFAVTDLAINGHDLIEEFALKPGPILGRVLQELFQHVLENPDLNTRDKLMEIAKKQLDMESENK